MEKYEFRTKQPLWVWIPIAFILIFAIIYVGMTKKYELGIIWLIYAIITFLAGHFTYTITPNYFIYNPGLGKTRKFPLANITEIERKMSKNEEIRSIIVRYSEDKIYHNFFKENILNILIILSSILIIFAYYKPFRFKVKEWFSK